jgi:2-polyprenyl-3-methyl-5-hydroxy-6-metoxy-1,4-benzoquinol methylase
MSTSVERKALEPIDYYADAAWPVALQDRQVVAIELLRSVVTAEAGRVLDVGCGDGMFLSELDRQANLTARGWELHGVDYSEGALSRARSRPYTFAQCNLEEGIPYPDGTFDVLSAGELIEHIYDPDALLREARRVLRPGGSLLITTPNLQAWYNRALFLAGIQPLFYETSTKSTRIGAGPIARLKRGSVPVGHVRVFNRRALVDLLESEGFRPVSIRGAVFEALPAPVRRVDQAFNRLPSLASNLVVLSNRV